MSIGVLDIRGLPLMGANLWQKGIMGTSLILGLLKGELKLIHICCQISKKSHE